MSVVVLLKSANKITAANAGEGLGCALKPRVCLSPGPGVAEFNRSAAFAHLMTTSSKGRSRVPTGWIVSIGAVLMCYPLSAVVVSVLTKRGIISTTSPVFRTVAHFYDPFFAVISYIPGADDAFTRVTCW